MRRYENIKRERGVPPERIAGIRSRLPRLGIEAILILDMINIRYLTGFAGSEGALLIGQEWTTLLVDGRYATQARQEAPEVKVFEYQDKIDGIVTAILNDGAKTVGFEAQAISYDTYARLKDSLKGAKLKPISDEIGTIRAIKDEREIALIRKAAEISSGALTSVRDLIRPGVRERDIAIDLEFKMRHNGAEQVSFATIVASGTNTTLPHAAPSNRKIENGDIVVIDCGAVYNGYHSDETCTFVVGQATPRQKEVYRLVKEAHDRALDNVRAGVPCSEIDRVARTCIEDGGLGAYFPHGTGHGVGLDIHEAPRIAAKSKCILEAGMVVTIEPGVYIPDLWGIRIEDTVLVEEDGCEVLTKTAKDFRILT
ncbi:MAG: Xaa-Pro peptidase family protein [Syntrophales bacterium]|nr:Xaa-Pro peptidase family protein [Syntrophales bacterium]